MILEYIGLEKMSKFLYNNSIATKGGMRVADSNITKRALASALKELMTEEPFSKISVTDICERCGMNRKSFYYHFKDKYDLVNWIFDSEFLLLVRDNSAKTSWELFDVLCHYLYDNRKFYKPALQIEGQNSFSDHFREMLRVTLRSSFSGLLDEYEDFQLNFYADALVCTIERWLTSKKCDTPDEFLKKVGSCARSFSKISDKVLPPEK